MEIAVNLDLSACQLSDALVAQGISGAAGLEGITPIDSKYRIQGRAFTVTYAPADGNEDAQIEYLAHVKPGDVIMLAHGGRLDCSVWGGQRTIGAQQHGALGTVIDGAFRDIPEHLALDYPVWGLGHTVRSGKGLVVPVAYGQTVTLCGVEVNAGDLVAADASGVVVVPAAVEAETFRLAMEFQNQEAEIASAVASGTDFVAIRDELRGTDYATR